MVESTPTHPLVRRGCRPQVPARGRQRLAGGGGRWPEPLPICGQSFGLTCAGLPSPQGTKNLGGGNAPVAAHPVHPAPRRGTRPQVPDGAAGHHFLRFKYFCIFAVVKHNTKSYHHEEYIIDNHYFIGTRPDFRLRAKQLQGQIKHEWL